MHIRKNQVYRINIEFNNFQKIVPNNTDSSFEFTGTELIHAIATCGVINPLSESSSELKYKKYALESQFYVKNDELFLNDKYGFFDSSEKRCLSYFRGMIFGRLIADKRFDLNVFVHLGAYKNTPKMILTASRNASGMNPDIIAWNTKRSNEYYVWECKGYKEGLSNGKKQAEKISKVNGIDVKAKIVSAIYPTGINKKIFAAVNDPIEEGEDIQLDIDKALEVYYAPIVGIIKSSSLKNRDNKMQFGIAEIDSEEYKLGLPIGIFDYFDSNQKSNKGTLKDILMECSENQFNERENIFNDYIYIK